MLLSKTPIMRPIPLSRKSHVEDVKVGSIFPTHLIAYDLVLFVDDNNGSPTVLEINLEKNSRAVGFKDDFADFVAYAPKFEYIALSSRNSAKFLKQWHSKFNLSICILRIICSKKAGVFEYAGKIEVNGESVRFLRKHSD